MVSGGRWCRRGERELEVYRKQMEEKEEGEGEEQRWRWLRTKRKDEGVKSGGKKEPREMAQQKTLGREIDGKERSNEKKALFLQSGFWHGRVGFAEPACGRLLRPLLTRFLAFDQKRELIHRACTSPSSSTRVRRLHVSRNS